jgi:hypothetical protein
VRVLLKVSGIQIWFWSTSRTRTSFLHALRSFKRKIIRSKNSHLLFVHILKLFVDLTTTLSCAFPINPPLSWVMHLSLLAIDASRRRLQKWAPRKANMSPRWHNRIIYMRSRVNLNQRKTKQRGIYRSRWIVPIMVWLCHRSPMAVVGLLPWVASKALNGDGTSAYHLQPPTCIAVVTDHFTTLWQMPRMHHQAGRYPSRRQLQVINPTVYLKTCITRKGGRRSDGRAFHSKGNVSISFTSIATCILLYHYVKKIVTTTSNHMTNTCTISKTSMLQ